MPDEKQSQQVRFAASPLRRGRRAAQKLHHRLSVMRRFFAPPAALFGNSIGCQEQPASASSYSRDG
jgi:hypothetical protein